MFSWQGPRGTIGEAGYPREPGGLEAKVPLGLAVTTLLRGKQTQPSWDGEEGNQTVLMAGRKVSLCHLVFFPNMWVAGLVPSTFSHVSGFIP